MKDDFANLETEKVGRKIKKNSDPVSLLVQNFVEEHDEISSILKKNNKNITKAIDKFTSTFSAGGSIYFIGAGTSGRLGVLEAAECPPTFGTSPNKIIALMAGGNSAVFNSKEGAEDSSVNSQKDLKNKKFSKNDLLIGISASGTSEYVLSGIKFAKKLKAKTILISCNHLKNKVSDLDLELNVGSEFVAGSTRLKSGTITKNVLNIITTVSMIKLEKIYNNLMIDIVPSTKKLRARSIRNLSLLLHINEKLASSLLNDSKWSIRVAVIIFKMKLPYQKAKSLSKKISIVELLDA